MNKLSTLMAIVLLQSCASHINSNQQRKLNIIKAERPEIYTEEKSEASGFWLGFLPGGGSFYTRQYGYGAANLLLWPISIIWDPANGQGGAADLNYEATMLNVRNTKKKEIAKLDDKLDSKEINDQKYKSELRKIEDAYSFE